MQLLHPHRRSPISSWSTTENIHPTISQLEALLLDICSCKWPFNFSMLEWAAWIPWFQKKQQKTWMSLIPWDGAKTWVNNGINYVSVNWLAGFQPSTTYDLVTIIGPFKSENMDNWNADNHRLMDERCTTSINWWGKYFVKGLNRVESSKTVQNYTKNITKSC